MQYNLLSGIVRKKKDLTLHFHIPNAVHVIFGGPLQMLARRAFATVVLPADFERKLCETLFLLAWEIRGLVSQSNKVKIFERKPGYSVNEFKFACV